MTTSSEQETLPSIKGSWEYQLQEAQQLAGNFNDDALPIFAKLYTRLGKMPKSKRMIADGRLQNIFLQTAFDYQTYLTMRARGGEAVAVLDRMIEEVPREQRDSLLMHSTFVLLQDGQADAAIGRASTRAEESEAGTLNTWGDLALLYSRVGRLDEADATADKMDAIVAEVWQDIDDNDEEKRVDQAYVAMLRAVLAMERADWDETVTRFNEAVAFNPAYASQIGTIYTRMVRDDEPARALELMARDDMHPFQTAFWRGLAYHRLGEADKATAEWEPLAAVDPSAEETPNPFELVMARYYLGDEDGSGLAVVLRFLQEREDNAWGLFVLAALGWAMRENMVNTNSNLETAMMIRRAQSTGSRYLPPEIWMFFKDLLEEEQLAELVKYFDIEATIVNEA